MRDNILEQVCCGNKIVADYKLEETMSSWLAIFYASRIKLKSMEGRGKNILEN